MHSDKCLHLHNYYDDKDIHFHSLQFSYTLLQLTSLLPAPGNNWSAVTPEKPVFFSYTFFYGDIIHPKCIIQQFLVYSQRCATITI